MKCIVTIPTYNFSFEQVLALSSTIKKVCEVFNLNIFIFGYAIEILNKQVFLIGLNISFKNYISLSKSLLDFTSFFSNPNNTLLHLTHPKLIKNICFNPLVRGGFSMFPR